MDHDHKFSLPEGHVGIVPKEGFQPSFMDAELAKDLGYETMTEAATAKALGALAGNADEREAQVEKAQAAAEEKALKSAEAKIEAAVDLVLTGVAVESVALIADVDAEKLAKQVEKRGDNGKPPTKTD